MLVFVCKCLSVAFVLCACERLSFFRVCPSCVVVVNCTCLLCLYLGIRRISVVPLLLFVFSLLSSFVPFVCVLASFCYVCFSSLFLNCFCACILVVCPLLSSVALVCQFRCVRV